MTASSITLRFAAAAAGLLLLAAPAPAQAGQLDDRWQPWIGCWQPATDPGVSGTPIVCVVPGAAAASVDVVTIEQDSVRTRYTVRADGQHVSVDRDGCRGWERAEWARNGRRVFLRSDLSCGEGLQRTSTGMLAFSPDGEWIDVQAVTAGGNTLVRSVTYRQAPVSEHLTAGEVSAVAGRQPAVQTARMVAGRALGIEDVIEASNAVDAAVVERWLGEHGQRFRLDAGALAQLADAGVPGSVTDVMIALSYPDRFALSDARLTARDSARIAEQERRRMRGWACDRYAYHPYGWGYSPCFSPYYGFTYMRYGRYGHMWGPSYYFYRPVVVVPARAAPPRGQAVKGSGYTRPGSSSGSSGGTATRAGRAGSTEKESGSSSSGSTRTAKPRPE